MSLQKEKENAVLKAKCGNLEKQFKALSTKSQDREQEFTCLERELELGQLDTFEKSSTVAAIREKNKVLNAKCNTFQVKYTETYTRNLVLE